MHIGVLNSILLAYPKHSAGTLAGTRLWSTKRSWRCLCVCFVCVYCCLFPHVVDGNLLYCAVRSRRRSTDGACIGIDLFAHLFGGIHFLVVVANGAAVTPNCESPNWPPPSAWHWRLMRTQPVQIIARMWHKITSVALWFSLNCALFFVH